MTTKQLVRQIVLTLTFLGFTGLFFALSIDILVRELLGGDAGLWPLISDVLYFIVITAFAYGNFLYQLTRLGYYRRSLAFQKNQPEQKLRVAKRGNLAILIPSYKEEVTTVIQTVMSAALMDYPHKTVTVLIDDPPHTNDPEDAARLAKTKRLIWEVNSYLATMARRYQKLSQSANRRIISGNFNMANEIEALAKTYEHLAKHYLDLRRQSPVRNHVDKHFSRTVMGEPAEHYYARAAQIRRLKTSPKDHSSFLSAQYKHIAHMTNTPISYFQRKAYQNLAHEPNKAMNINSYISVMGRSFNYQEQNGQTRLIPARPQAADIRFDDSAYIITLDADSILSHHYATKLIDFLEQPANSRVAVVQTPYSAFAGSSNIIERTAGATTDMQYIIHQGFTSYRATYWVGANALIRKQALNDIAEPIAGQPIMKQYIQDRTVIEDTESSIDLINKGWQLYNYPERLAHSATPSDYGSLIIQRRRWANGGLIILPKLLKYLLFKPSARKLPEGFMRIHYLVSIALVNLGLVTLLFVPLETSGFSIWVPITAIPYFCLYYIDLKSIGYSFGDLLRIYALNLILIPINIAGVLKSLQQLITRKKIPFGRTPKVNTRTTAPLSYHVVTYLLTLYLVYISLVDIAEGKYGYAALILMNAIFLSYGLIYFIGLKATRDDFGQAISSRFKNVSLIPRKFVPPELKTED